MSEEPLLGAAKLPSLPELHRRIRDGQLTPSELVASCLRSIQAREPSINAWAYLAENEARRAAAELTAELREKGPRGPLHGIPFGVKDIFDTQGMATQWGSPLYAGRTPGRDSELVAELRRAGAIVLGKTHTTAFAYFDAGPARNPHNPAHTPGGSSSGSAAAVAAGMVPFAIGSQTQGSVLRPAAFCGVAGWKPTFGSLPLGGVLPFAPSLDHAGFFTATVEDMRFLWAAQTASTLPNGAPAAPFAAPFAAPDWPIDSELEPAMEAALPACYQRLRRAGLGVEHIPLPDSFRQLAAAARTVNTYEGARTHQRRYREHGAKIGTKLAALVEDGLRMEESTYQQSLQVIEEAKVAFANLTDRYPVWITPAAPGAAPAGLGCTGDPRCNAPFTALGVPAISLPFASADNGLPLGLQLSAAAGNEGLLLGAALWCERVFAAASSA